MPSKSVIKWDSNGVKMYTVEVFAQVDLAKEPEETVIKTIKPNSSKMSYGLFTQIAEITDHLYLSSAAAITPERLREIGITHIINCTTDIPNLNVPRVESIQIHIEDSPHAQLSVYFDRIANKVRQVAGQGGKTLIHCVAGVSRSATLCMVYLMVHYGMNLEKAYNHVKARRTVIQPNVGFWQQLIQFERRLYGRPSIKLVSSSVGAMSEVHKDTPRRDHVDTSHSNVSRYSTYTSPYSKSGISSSLTSRYRTY